MSRRILCTGADGFVGTHLCRELLKELPSEDEVVATDRFQYDLAEPDCARRMIERWEPTYVVHLAARYGRLLCADEPHRSVSDNTASTTEVAQVCAEYGIPVLYTSSSEVYGDHGEDLITEESELRTPTTIYGLSKRWGEEVLRLYLPPENLCIVRANMLFGPGQLGGYGRCSLATFIQNAIEFRPYTVHRNATRSWLFISDAVRAFRQLIEGNHSGIFNLGNPAPPIPMLKVAEMVGGDYEVIDPPAGQIPHKNYDCSKLLKTIDWMPRVTLQGGIAMTTAWAAESTGAVAA